MTGPLDALTAAGVSIWLDDLSRARLDGGELARLVAECRVTGVTTNPTIFAAAVAAGDLYDEQLRELAARPVTVDEALRQLTTDDVRAAADVLRRVYDDSGGRDGYVSIEVDPRLAHETERTVAEARVLWEQVDRPNLFVKIPATPAGLPAISTCLADGININVTLIFGLNRYDQVIDAFLEGMEAAHRTGHGLSHIASVASLFVSRLDTAVDALLDGLATAKARHLRGKAALANAHLAAEHHRRAFSSDRWVALAAAGARPQRLLWASTGVKDPAYDDTRYVTGLVTTDTIATMPEATLRAVAHHGRITGDTVLGRRAEQAHRVLSALAGLGIRYAEIVRQLEDDGVAAFEASWDRLSGQVADKLDRFRATAHHASPTRRG
ncbi:MAG TPA: transaldolase [Jiangellaceae bacterium]|nr:transaldolase [Jiangellaceae bacterium]